MATAGESPVAAPRILLERLRAAADAEDWDALRALCHPDARLVLRISEGHGLELEAALEVLQSEAEAGEFEPIHYYVDDLDDHAVIALGSVARKGTHRHLCWLLTFVDGLLYRQGLYRTLSEAQAAYAALGIDLGLPPGGGRRDARSDGDQYGSSSSSSDVTRPRQ